MQRPKPNQLGRVNSQLTGSSCCGGWGSMYNVKPNLWLVELRSGEHVGQHRCWGSADATRAKQSGAKQLSSTYKRADSCDRTLKLNMNIHNLERSSEQLHHSVLWRALSLEKSWKSTGKTRKRNVLKRNFKKRLMTVQRWCGGVWYDEEDSSSQYHPYQYCPYQYCSNQYHHPYPSNIIHISIVHISIVPTSIVQIKLTIVKELGTHFSY